jgi:phytol kinase
MSRGDLIGLGLSYVYAFGLLFAVEAIGRRLRWAQEFTRKIIHIGAGLLVWGILYFFDHWYYGIIPFGTFILLNYLFYRQQTFKAMDTERSTLGTVYFAFSITVLFALFWRTGGQRDHVSIAAAATMAMTLGDAVASIVGRRYGIHTYTILGHTRSWEGTAAMTAVSLIGVLSTLLFLPGSTLSPNSVPWGLGTTLLLSVVGTSVATAAEAVSPAGTDNLSVPLLAGLALYLCSVAIGGPA